MHDAAVSDSAYPIDGHDLMFDSSGLPFYWIFHETGRSSNISGMAEFARKAAELGMHVDESAGGGMPARPFVGVSFEAQLQIVEVFDAWFEGGIAGFYTGGGSIQTRLPSGRFGPAIRRG
jgi:hypothetical protein